MLHEHRDPPTRKFPHNLSPEKWWRALWSIWSCNLNDRSEPSVVNAWEAVIGIKQVTGMLYSAARDWSQVSSLSLASSRKHTSAGFPLNADSENASTCLSTILRAEEGKGSYIISTLPRRTWEASSWSYLSFLSFLLKSASLNMDLYSSVTHKSTSNVWHVLIKKKKENELFETSKHE